MSFTPQELEAMPKQFERHMEDLGLHILSEIIDRIKAGNGITRTVDYLIYKYDQIKGFDEATKKYIQQATKLSEQELDNLFDNVIAEGYARDKELYTATGSKFVEYKDNEQLQQYIETVRQHTKNELRNITNTTGYMVNLNGKKVYTPASQVFQDSLDKAVNQVMQGTTSYNEVIKAVCKELTDSDLRTVDYSTGRSYNLPAAARMCVMTAVTQVTGKITEMNMEALGTEYVEVSWHATARPSHQVWQGRVFRWKKKVEKLKSSDIIKTGKQIGNKIGEHAKDFGLNPSKAEDREKMEKIIDDIIDNCDEVRTGDWRGQIGDVDFYIKGNNVVVVNGKKFVTILEGGINNARVKNARKR